MSGTLEDTVAISREITQAYFAGNMEPYLSRLCSKSVWLGTGGRVLIGGDIIRARLEAGVGKRKQTYQITQEEYTPLYLTPRCQAVMGEVRAVLPEHPEEDSVIASYTFLYQLIGTETKLVLLHANYEFLHPFALNEDGPKLEMSAYQFVRDVLIEIPPKKRLAVPCGNTTLFVQPDMIFYIQSRNRKAELHCVDKIIQSDLSINEVNAMLPETFCSIHRCYTVNSRYVMSVRRYEAALITGEVLPIPFHNYMQVKADLERIITG